MRTSTRIILLLIAAALLTAFGNYQEQKQERYEEECPGAYNIAPKETLIEINGTLVYQIRHNGISLGPDNVSFSVVDPQDNNKVVFGDTVAVKTNEPFVFSGVDFRERGTEDQEMVEELFSLTASDQNACIQVELPQ